MAQRGIIELSHVIRDGLVTYPGLPAPVITDHLSREASREHYAPGTEFQIGRITMVANTGTYVDTPVPPICRRRSTSGVSLERLVDLDGVVVECRGAPSGRSGRRSSCRIDVAGRAVLRARPAGTRHFGTPSYLAGPSVPDGRRPQRPRRRGRDARGHRLPQHRRHRRRRASPPTRTLLAAGIPICEHLTGLDGCPRRASASAPRRRGSAGMGTFPVRAYATGSTAGRRPCSIQRLMTARCACAVWGVPGRCRVARRCAWTGHDPAADSPVPGLAPDVGEACRMAPREPPPRSTCHSQHQRSATSIAREVQRSVRWDGGAAVIIDQRQLPGRLVHRRLSTVDAAVDAIRTLAVRGADAIGITGAYGMVTGLIAAGDVSRADALDELDALDSAHRRRASDRGQPGRGRCARVARCRADRRTATPTAIRRRCARRGSRHRGARTAAACAGDRAARPTRAGRRAAAPDPLQHRPSGHGG